MHPKTLLRSLVVSMVALATLTLPAHAVDGVKLINQSVAVNGTASSDDDPGFPVTISKAGSYRLSGPGREHDGDRDHRRRRDAGPQRLRDLGANGLHGQPAEL